MENAQATGERFLVWRIHVSLARLYRATAREPEAAVESTIARDLIEELADTIPEGDLRDNFLRRAHDGLNPSA
jgi:hypothetical protein